MIDNMSKGDELGVEPIKGKGWIQFRFHGGPQTRINRVVLLGTGTFVELQKGVEELLGNQSDAVFYDAGIRSGKEAKETMDKELSEKGDALIERLFSILKEDGLGWFKVEELKFDGVEKRGSVKVSKSFIGDSYGRAEKPVCHFLAGFIAGVMSVIWKIDVICNETQCSAVSGNYCIFEWEAALE